MQNEEIKTYAEIKLTGKFKGEKASQALQWLQLHPYDSLIMIIFCPNSLEDIKQEIFHYSELQGFGHAVYQRLYYILINNPYAFAPIIGFSKVDSDINKIIEFLEAFAHWLEFFGSFSSQYQKIKQELGIDFFQITPKKEKKKLKREEKKEIELKLTQEQQIILNLLSAMFHHRKFSKTGRMNKTTIENFIAEKSLGITDIEKYFEIMARTNIIESNTRKQVTFSEKIIKAFTLDELQKVITGFFSGSKKGLSLLDQYV